MSRDRPRVLLLAESANPESSSVSLEGFSLAQALGRLVDAHLVTRLPNGPALERAGWRERRDYTAIDTGPVERPVHRFETAVRKITGFGWTLTTALSAFPHAYFERRVWRAFGDAIRRRDYDLVHRLNPVSPAVPSALATRCREVGVPFVLGPLNGGVPWPREFRSALRREGEWLAYLRSGHRFVPGYRSTRAAASAILAGSTHVWGELQGYHDRSVYIPENGIDPERVRARLGERRPGPLAIAFVGRLVPYKGADMLVEAAAPLIRAGRATLDIIGDGPEMAKIRAQVERERIGSGVTLPGWIEDQREVGPRLARCDVFAFPSIREFGGGVVVEAMGVGLAPVIANYAGPSELVTDATGFRVPMGPRPTLIAGFRRVLEDLADHPERAREIGERARARVYRHFTWEAKARQVVEVYRWVLGERDRPDFGMPLPDPIPGDDPMPLAAG